MTPAADDAPGTPPRVCLLRRHDQTLGDRFPNNVHARERARLLVDLGLDGGDGSVVEGDGNKDDLRVHAVLGLGQEVGGDEGGVGGVVRDDLCSR